MPDFDDIDRLYMRQKTPPSPGMDGYKRLVTGGTKWAAILFIAVSFGIGLSAAADQLFQLGWGYHWRDVRAGLVMSALGAALYGVNRAWLTFIGFYRLSDPKRPKDEA